MCRTLAAFPTSCLERAKEFKTRLGIFLHKSELGSDTGSVGKFEWGSKHSKEGKNFSEDVLGWKESFDLLLSSKNGVAAFHAFLKTELVHAGKDVKKVGHIHFDESVKSSGPWEIFLTQESNLHLLQVSCITGGFFNAEPPGIPTALNISANLGNTAAATGLEEVSFHSNPQKVQGQRIFKLPYYCAHFSC
uniref:Uncharacterized protein n=1 Tax=Bos indicus x Bos taurus TaxID=30522 RepID=A0A4W2FEA8_BOBOX